MKLHTVSGALLLPKSSLDAASNCSYSAHATPSTLQPLTLPSQAAAVRVMSVHPASASVCGMVEAAEVVRAAKVLKME